jgi:hypothetical protein
MTDIIKHYPELDKIADEIVKTTAISINTKTRMVESEMPYKAQYVLEMVIQKLQQKV